ncbi:hypothetical protein AVEN_100235-1, partial [Araneus ventricosus]
MGGGAVGLEYPPLSFGEKKPGPFSGQQIASPSTTLPNFPTFFLIKRSSTSNENFHTVSPFLVEKAIIATVGEVKSTKKLRSGDFLVEVHSRKQSQQIVKLKTFSNIPITVSPHASLNSSKGVITCGELLNVPTEEILKELQGQGVSHVRRISIRRDGQLLNTKHLILTFDSAKLPENIKAGYMRLSVVFPTHSAVSSANVSDIRKPLAAGHSPAPVVQKSGMKVLIALVQRSVLTTPTPGNSYVSVAKKSFSEPSVQKNPDASAVTCSKPSDSTAKASPPITSLPISSSLSVVPVSEEALASPDFTDFKVVRNRKKLKRDSPSKTNHSITKAEKISKFYTTSRREIINPIPTKDNISTHQSTVKPSVIAKPTSVDIELLLMAVLPPLEKLLLQSRESDADAEMSSSSASDEDALEYNMKKNRLKALRRRAQRAPQDQRNARFQFHKEELKKYMRKVKTAKNSGWKSFCTIATNPYGTLYKAAFRKAIKPAELIALNNQDPSGNHLKIAQDILEKIFPHPANSNSSTYIPPCTANDCPFTKGEVATVIHHLSKGKAPGLDGIDNIIIQQIFKKFPFLLMELFNICLKLAKFADPLKVGNIIIFHKHGKSKTEASSYRPISLLPTIGKVLEKLLTQRLNFHLEKNNRLSNLQYGF